MQIVALGVFSRDGRRRDVKFRLGELNILTGQSKTGKTAILEIVDYCLGRNAVTIPSGKIIDNASWFYVLVQFSDSRVLICRPNPETASTKQAMIQTGDIELNAPSFDQLVVNADTDVVKDTLTEKLGIESFQIDPSDYSLRHPFEVSARHSLFYCFQNQNEIGNRDVLFHRESEKGIKESIKDTLPYFLGAATPAQSIVQRQLKDARRVLRRTQNEIHSLQGDLDQQDGRIVRLLESAVNLDILPQEIDRDTNGNIRPVLEEIISYNLSGSEGGTIEVDERRKSLLSERNDLRQQLRVIDDQVDYLSSLQSELLDSQNESQYQIDRLKAIDLMLPKSALADGDVSVCPLCDQGLSHDDESIEELQSLLFSLEAKVASSKNASSRRQDSIVRLGESRVPILAALRQNAVALEVIAQQEIESAAGREKSVSIAFLQGRVSQELERGVDSASNIEALRSDEKHYKDRVNRLEERYERDNPDLALRSVVDSLSDLMTDFARALQLEGAEHSIILDPINLTVVIQKPGGRVPLKRMGSAENWVGYHLVTYLALHHWFTVEERPVPRFVMFDQPTQAFFPEKIIDASKEENADWEAVKRQFILMHRVVEQLQGELQIVVCDHANLGEKWFQDSVVENWRNGVALIPIDWLEEGEV